MIDRLAAPRRASNAMRLAAVLGVAMLGACGGDAPKAREPEPPRLQLRIDHFVSLPAVGAMCEIEGQLTNTGPSDLVRPLIVATFYQGDQHKGVAQIQFETPVARRQSSTFRVAYPCSKNGDRVVFSATDREEEVGVLNASPRGGQAERDKGSVL